jgi:hypothetical protein
MLNKTKNSDWVYLDESDAINHKYYGIKGFAKFLALGLLMPLIMNLLMILSTTGIFESFPFIDMFLSAMRSASHLGYNIIWVSVPLVFFYLLITHNKIFQKTYLLYIVISTLSVLYVNSEVILNTINNVEMISSSATRFRILIRTLIGPIIAGTFWFLYILKSKRINLTIRGRIKKKYL